MCCCFQTFKELSAFSPPDFFDRVAKVQAFIISTKFFCYFFEVFSFEFQPDDLKNCRFFEAGCKVTTFIISTKFFCRISEDFFFLL
jgi:hypothetical protein